MGNLAIQKVTLATSLYTYLVAVSALAKTKALLDQSEANADSLATLRSGTEQAGGGCQCGRRDQAG